MDDYVVVKFKSYDKNGVYVTKRTPPLFVNVFLIIILAFFCAILFALINIANPLLLLVMSMLAVVISLLIWFSMTYKELTYYCRGKNYVERITSYFGKPRKIVRILIGGYREVQYGHGLITSSTAGGRSQYVILANGDRECNFEVVSTRSRDEAAIIADTVSQQLSLPKTQINWNEDPTFHSNIKGYCAYIRRVI